MARPVPKKPPEKIRSKRLSVSVREDTYERIVRAADDVGLSVGAWCAYTLAQAASSHASLRDKMTDEMVALMARAIAEGEQDGSLDA